MSSVQPAGSTLIPSLRYRDAHAAIAWLERAFGFEQHVVYASAQAAGAEIVMELRTMDYGGKAFTVRDPEGYTWAVGEYDPWKASK
jgi:uncharacterized glyoxalase superfamily protein PhnB